MIVSILILLAYTYLNNVEIFHDLSLYYKMYERPTKEILQVAIDNAGGLNERQFGRGDQ